MVFCKHERYNIPTIPTKDKTKIVLSELFGCSSCCYIRDTAYCRRYYICIVRYIPSSILTPRTKALLQQQYKLIK